MTEIYSYTSGGYKSKTDVSAGLALSGYCEGESISCLSSWFAGSLSYFLVYKSFALIFHMTLRAC